MTSNYTFGLLEGENNLTHQEAVSTHVYPILWPFQRAQAIRGQMVSTETHHLTDSGANFHKVYFCGTNTSACSTV